MPAMPAVAQRVGSVLHAGRPGEESVTWAWALGCGHRVERKVRYYDTDGPGDAGPHLPPSTPPCPHGCQATAPAPIVEADDEPGLGLAVWAGVALALAAALCWLVIK